jgi:hypothetical protein
LESNSSNHPTNEKNQLTMLKRWAFSPCLTYPHISHSHPTRAKNDDNDDEEHEPKTIYVHQMVVVCEILDCETHLSNVCICCSHWQLTTFSYARYIRSQRHQHRLQVWQNNFLINNKSFTKKSSHNMFDLWAHSCGVTSLNSKLTFVRYQRSFIFLFLHTFPI